MPTLDLAIVPARSSEPGFFDLDLRLRFAADGPPVHIYPETARHSCWVGWAGPCFRWDVRCDGRSIEFRQFRTWYGPPGHPPPATYFQSHRSHLTGDLEHRLRGCLIQASALLPEHVAAQTLDPQGLDGYRDPPDDLAAVVVLDETAAELLERREQGPGFLRPGIVALLPRAASTSVSVAYEQRRAGTFDPEDPLVVQSSPVKLEI